MFADSHYKSYIIKVIVELVQASVSNTHSVLTFNKFREESELGIGPNKEDFQNNE